MSRKNNTRSIKKIQEHEAHRIDLRRRVEKTLGLSTDVPTEGKGWKLTPYQENMLIPGYAISIARDRK